MAIIRTDTWNGNSNIDFEKFLAQQSHAWIQCTQCVDHIQCVVSDEHSQVGYFLENIFGDFPKIMATMASFIMEYTSTGMRKDFKKRIAKPLPIAEGKKKGTNKHVHGRIS